MSNGVLMVAFGEQYDRFAAYCAVYSRRFTDLPITVISNLKNKSEKWKDAPNIDFINLDLPQDQNRQVKTSIIDYTPYDKTLYLDCDAIVQNSGLERIFDLIENDSLLLNIYGRWKHTSPRLGGYHRAFLRANVTFPVNIYYGALQGFTKSKEVRAFFKLWNTYWIENGRGREMPSLACAVQRSGIKVKEINKISGFFTWITNPRAIIQHEYGRHVRNLVGCSDFKAYKPFDRRIKNV